MVSSKDYATRGPRGWSSEGTEGQGRAARLGSRRGFESPVTDLGSDPQKRQKTNNVFSGGDSGCLCEVTGIVVWEID